MAPITRYGVETPLVKRPRADARRNRARLLAVAEEIFATAGPSASTERIAAAAGVGIGTLFRHFPTKESLLEAVFVERLRRLIAEADELASAPEAGSAFFTFFRSVLEQEHSKGAIADALEHAGVDLTHTMPDVKANLNLRMERLLLRAQEAGAVRDDISIAEVIALLVGAARAVEQVGGDAERQARTISVILDGLRPAQPPRNTRPTR